MGEAQPALILGALAALALLETPAAPPQTAHGATFTVTKTADHDREVTLPYDMIHPNASATATIRSVFIVGPAKKLRLTLTYPASTGRNFAELLRVIDSLRLTEYNKVATPADWQDGEDVIILPTISDEDAKKLFPSDFTTHRPYLRTTKAPR